VTGNKATMSAVARCQSTILRFHKTNVVPTYHRFNTNSLATMTAWNNTACVLWVWLSDHRTAKISQEIFANGQSTKNFVHENFLPYSTSVIEVWAYHIH